MCPLAPPPLFATPAFAPTIICSSIDGAIQPYFSNVPVFFNVGANSFDFYALKHNSDSALNKTVEKSPWQY